MRSRLSLLAVVMAALALTLQPLVGGSIRVLGAPSPITLNELVGVNAVVNNTPADFAQVVGWIRDYQKWYWYEPAPDDYRWESSWQFLGNFYRSTRANGVKILADVERAAYWASSNGNIDGVPDATAHADYIGDMAAYFGSTISAVENFNEPNQTWQPVRFPASQFGAMTAQDYAAVKAANPSLPFVLAGMAGPDTTYLTQANQASGGAFDIVNFHWYPPGNTTLGGQNPESGTLFDHIGWVKAWRDANAPSKPIWITEFGWDTFVGSQRSAIAAPEANAANYLLRTLFLMQGQGVEKAFIFIYRDVNSTSATQYNSTGLVTNNSEHDGRKKVSWYYLATLKNTLGNYVLDHVVSDGPHIYEYEYSLPGTTQKAAVLWARDALRDSGYTTPYQGPAGTLVVPQDGSTTGAISATDGQLILSERPVFVLYSSTDAATSTPTASPSVTATATTRLTPTPTTSPTSSSTATATSTASVTTTSSPTRTSTVTRTPTPTATPYGGLPPGSELLANGGFEAGLDPWQTPAWDASMMSADDQVTHGGVRSLRFQGNAPGPYVYQELPAAPGDAFAFSGWFNMPVRLGASSAVVELVARPAGTYDLKTFPVVTIASQTNGWVQMFGSAVMPAQTAKVWVRIRFPQLNGTIYFDDLSLSSPSGGSSAATATTSPTPTSSPIVTLTTATSPTPSSTPTVAWTATVTSTTVAVATPTPTVRLSPTLAVTGGDERLVNGGFESGLDGWYLPAWYATPVSVVSSTAHQGAQSLRFSGNVSGPYVYQELSAQPGNRFDVSAWVNVLAQNAGSAMTVELVARHADGWEISALPIANVSGFTNGWTSIQGSAVMPDRTAKAWLRIRFAQLNGTFAIDDVSVKLASP